MRARSSARFIIAIPLSGALGGPLGARLLDLDGRAGLFGWQWLFLVEGIPAVIMGFVVLRYLTERPEEASWLRPDQREWLIARLRLDVDTAPAPHGLPPLRALANRTVWLAGLPLFFLNFAGYGYIFWGPTLIRESLHTSNAGTGWIIAALATLSAAALLIAGVYADRTRRRPLHAAGWAAVVAIACAGAAVSSDPLVRLGCLALIQIGGAAFLPSFVAIPTILLNGPSVAIGVALVNSVGNLAGFGAPSLIGYLRSFPQGDRTAFLVLAIFGVIAAGILLRVQRHPVFASRRTEAE
jgi:MFS family permease